MIVIFENFSLDLDRRELQRDGELIAVQPQVFDLLVYLIQNNDRVVTRDDLIEHVWHGRIVSESTLATRINAARNALGDNGTDQRLIRTVHGKGIRFVGTLMPDQTTAATTPATTPPSGEISEKANLYLPAISCPNPDAELENIAHELRDTQTTAFAGDPLYALKLDTPPDDGLGTGYSLTGTLRRNGDQIRLSIRLSNIETASLIWAEQFDIPPTENTSLLSYIADKIIGRTYADLQRDRSSHAKEKAIDQADATELYYRSRSLIRTRIPADNIEAEKLVRRSIAMAPGLFGGQMGLAVIYLVRTSAVWTKDIPGDLEIGRQAANAAASADENSVGPMQMLAYYSAYKRQFSVAMEYVGDCERLRTSRASAKALRGVMLSFQGQYEESLVLLEWGQRTDADQKKSYVLNIGRTHFLSGDFERAIPKLEKFIGQCPAGDLAQLFLGNCYDAIGQHDRARACVATQLALCPFTTIKRISHVTPYPEDALKTFHTFLRKYNIPET